jgi:hypothetical protein
MNTHVRRSCMALAVAGALFSVQAGALSASAYDDVSPPQNITVFEPGGTMTEYIFADPELVAVAEPDGMVTIYELAPFALAPDAADWNVSSSGDSGEFTVYIPDGTGWAYVPSRFVSPEEAAIINAALDDESKSPVYVASFVSPPAFRVTMEE